MNNEYEHGANIYLFAKIAMCKEEEVIDFSSNVNCIYPNINTKIELQRIKTYPDIKYLELKQKIKQHYKLSVETVEYDIELFNGASSGIYSFFRFIKEMNNNEVNLYAPLYIEYKKVTKILGIKTNIINRLNNITKEVKKNSSIVFVNPSTPDGTLYNMTELMQYWQKQNCTIFTDESFLDFTKAKSLIEYINLYKNLYVLKSFTKFYGFAGLRVGLIASSKNNIKELREFEPPWKLSTFDSISIMECIKQKNFHKESYITNTSNKQLLIKTLTNSGLFSNIYPSSANFILAKMRKYKANELQTLLIPYLIYIRNCHNFDFLDSSFVRFAVKDKQSINKLNYALSKVKKKVL